MTDSGLRGNTLVLSDVNNLLSPSLKFPFSSFFVAIIPDSILNRFSGFLFILLLLESNVCYHNDCFMSLA